MQDEVHAMDRMQKEGYDAGAILTHMKASRAKQSESGPSRTVVYDFLNGSTYQRDKVESRGRQKMWPARLLAVAEKERIKLIKTVENQYMVTWADVHAATAKQLKTLGLLTRGQKMPSVDWFARLIRANSDVRSRIGKRRLDHTDIHRKLRYTGALRWNRYSKRFWLKDIHGYIDNKKFILAKKIADERRMRASKVTRHLRSPSEGGQPGFVLPKNNRMLMGVPSIDITAAVAENKIFFWYVNIGKWNGSAAATMYKALGQSLRKRYGHDGPFRVVEDSDSKGYQSNAGKDEKKKQKITSWRTPPRTPSFMPLDYSLWAEVERRVLAKPVRGDETKEEYLKRLRSTALRLPKRLVERTVGKMKGNVQALVDSKGDHTQLD